MFKALSKLLFMMTLLVALLGQTMASHFIASNDDSFHFQTEIQQEMFVSYSNDSNTSQENEECCKVECCETECICPANTCASVVFLDTNLPISTLVALSESMLPFERKAPHFIATSHYRPPIFTS